jgi:hypothetical protein
VSSVGKMTTDYFRYAALASPMGTPEHTPPGHPIMSKSSSRARTHRNFSTKSAPLPSFETSDKQEANANAAFDAKRLTSTLQASLVSEILTLRRDLDSKHVFIENLEESLKTAHNETENMSDRLRESNKKTRQLEHKIKQLENATFDAVQGLLYERDTLEATNKDLRKKLDAANKDIKSMGEQNVRSRESWDNHKQSWQKEKRQLEQKVHVSDVRVRTLVEELRTRQEVSPVQHEFGDAAEDRHVLDNDSYQHHGHYRNESNLSMRSLASSIVSLPPKSGMTSLANELDSDEDDYDTEVPEEDEDDEDLPLFAGNRCSTHSKASAISNRKAKTVLGFLEKPNTKLSIDIDRGRSNPGEIVKTPSFTERLGLQMAKINFRTSDSDKASSRSVSPVVTPKHREEHIDQSLHVLSLGETAGPIRPKAIDQGTQSDWSNMEPIETPISLPNTPWHLSCEDNWLQEKPIYTSASTQTEVAVTSDLALRRHASMISVETHLVPAIKIQPPLSPRGGDTVLPPGMRSVSVQTEAVVTTPMLDVGVQTIFRIPTKPWPHLMASALENSDDKENVTTGRHGVHATSRHGGMMHRSTFSKDGNRLPLIPLNIPPPRLQSTSSRSHQQSGTKIANDLAKWSPQWQVGSSASDSSRFNASSKGSDKQQSHHERIRMGSDDSSIQSRPSSSRGTGYSGKAGPFFASNQHGLSRPASNKEALPPPFPIPGRISSRPQSREGDQSPFAPPFVRSRRPARDSRIAPAGGLRKVQSSGGMRTNTRRSPRQRRKTPDLEPIQSMVFDTQSENLLFLNSEKQGRGNLASPNEDQPVYNPPDFDQDSAVEEEDETSEDNVIVDAIAGTMVGEWMWKYTRRRRSFGLGEFRDQPDDGVTSGVRHKRWVWLSPYEHTIMWSAKQPNSGPALLGKAGRTRES